jgi:hypothetical protein
MAIDAVWAWTFSVFARAESGRVTGSLHVNLIPTQPFVYIRAAVQRFRYKETPLIVRGVHNFPGIDVDANPIIESYTVNGTPRKAGSYVVFDNNVDSVDFSWYLEPGHVPQDSSSETNAQFLFQILGG